MLAAFKKHLDSHFQFIRNSKLLIAVSGGLDSVVLSFLCQSEHLNFALAHCNFNLRGKESDEDEDFVLDLAETLNVEVFIQNFDTQAYADQNKRSIQMAARELRYQWFEELAAQLNFDFILTAHHADDNLETFLINFTRGTGLNGLTGIPAIQNTIVRPLLPFSKEEIEHYAKENNLSWREDSSNHSVKYLRNKLRHDVVPILKEINPQLLNSFQNTIENLNDTADIVDESLNAVAKRAIVDIDGNGISYKISEFKKVNNPKAYLYEMFKDYGFTQWQDIVDLLNAQSGKQVMSQTYRLVKHRDYLILTDRHSGQNEESIIINDGNTSIKTPLGIVCFNDADVVTKHSKHLIYVDKDRLKFPLKLRLWKDGDLFYPVGMQGKKKISKYLKDEKLSLVEKEMVWLLTSNEDVVWVIGKRGDRRYKVTDATKHVLKVELKT